MRSKERTSLMRKAVISMLGLMLIFGMVPFSSMPIIGQSGSNAYAAMPADGTGWTASGSNGLKYFQGIYGTGNQITSLSYGATLSNNTYYIMNNITLEPTSTNLRLRTNALNISGNVKLIFLNNAKLTVTGGRAYCYEETYWEGGTKKTNYSTGGAGAGIYLPSNATLTVDGQGSIVAKGGAAGDGQKGYKPDGSYKNNDSTRGYKGGKGGRGGGGAGAGIGTKGAEGKNYSANGGSGDAGKGAADHCGTGNDGLPGDNSADSGTLIQYGRVYIDATGGAGGYGGLRGDRGEYGGGYRNGNGGSGGGGGAGGRGNAIGSGGPGGGSGAGGGGGAAKRSDGGATATGGGGGAGGGWTESRAAQGGYPGKAVSSEGGKSTGGYGGDGGSFTNYYFYGGSSGNSTSRGSAKSAAGGTGGRSGSYGTCGPIYYGYGARNANTNVNDTYRYKTNSRTLGSRYDTYMVVPLRELTATLTTNSSATKNPDGSYLYKNGTAVKPTVTIKHTPTGVNLTEDTYKDGAVNGICSFYTVYSNNVTSKPNSPAVVEATVQAKGNGSKANQAYPQICNNASIGSAPSAYINYKTLPYTIDFATYDVTLDAAGGIGSRTVKVKYGNNFTWGPGFKGEDINAPTREGYVFEGFYSEKNGKGTKYYESIVQSDGAAWARPILNWTKAGNGTIYANWTPLEYKIRFWSDYGEGSEYVEYNQKDFVYEKEGDESSAKLKPAVYGNLVLPSAHDLGISRDHYDFVGWNIYEEQDWAMYKAGKTYKAGLTTKQNDIVNIYAAWRAKDQLVVSYDANGGTGAPPADGTWADADFEMSEQIPVRDGYTFKGWNSAAAPQYDEETGKQTNGHAYEPGETVSKNDAERAITTPITMYAQWERNPSVSYRANGGTLETSIPTRYPSIHEDVDIDYSPISRTGYDFVGWNIKGKTDVYVEEMPESGSSITIDGTNYHLIEASSFSMPEKSVVLEALWTPMKMEIDYVTDSKGDEKGLYDLDGWYYADAEGNRLAETEVEGIKKVNTQEIEYDKSLNFQVVIDRTKVDDSGLRLRINDINTAPTAVVEDEENNTVTYKYGVAKVRGGQMIQAAGLVGQTFPVILDANEGELRGNVTSHTFGDATALPTRADSTDPDTGDPVDGNAPIKKGFAFQGWFDAEDEAGEPTGTQVEIIPATTLPTSEDGTLTYHAKWNTSKYNIAYDIGPLPGEDGSVLQWQDGVTKGDYEEAVSESDQYQDIPYSSMRTLPTLNTYVKYEYGALVDDEIKKVEAQFLGWSTKKGAGEPEYSAGHAVRRLTDKDGATVTLYPVWGAPHYKLVLDPNGGKITKPITGYQAGDVIDLTEVVPVRPGYEFGGWYDEKIADDADVSGKTEVTSIPADEFGDKTYYAYWTAKEYKYTLKGINTSTGEATSESWQPENKLKVGDKATLDLPDAIIPPTGKTLAGWTNEYIEDDEGAWVPDTVLFDAGEETADLWTVDDKGNFTGRTLYPVWKNEGDETLTYDDNGGEEGPSFVEAQKDSEVEIDFRTVPKRKGYIFAGYDTDKNKAYNEVTYPANSQEEQKITLSTSIRLYAIWQPMDYDITFDAAVAEGEENVGFDDGEGHWSTTMTQHVGTYDEEVVLAPETPSRGSMYQFLGWSTVENGQVEYQAGSVVSQFADEIIEEETIGEGDDAQTINKVVGLKGKTLYAVWLTKNPAYLSFDAMGGIGAPAMETHPQGETVDVTTAAKRTKPTYHGYTFKGWGTSSEDPAGTKVDEVTMPGSVANTTLYAIWEKNQGIKMSYDGGAGSTGSVPSDATVYYQGETVNVAYRPAPSKTGHEFLGWNVVDKDGNVLKELRKERVVGEGDEATTVEDLSFELTEEIFNAATDDGNLLTLKAVYKANEYTVTFDGNGAKSGEAPAAIKKTYGDNEKELPGPGEMVAPTGFSFSGWNTEKDGSGTMYSEGQVKWELSTAKGDEVTLYAIWEAGEADVVFENGDSPSFEETFQYGQALPDDMDAPKRAGYDFKGYYLEFYAHNDEGQYLNEAGEVVESKNEAAKEKVDMYDAFMEPHGLWTMTSDDLSFQVGGGNKFQMKADWEAQTYMISYHDQSGVLVGSEEITYDKAFRIADDADLETPAGYRHVGWKLKNDPDQLTPDFEADKAVTPTKANGLYNPDVNGDAQTVSVFAVYQEIKKFTVNYDANGGTDAPQDIKQYEQGKTVEVQFDPVPTRANYDFLGWTTYSNTQSVLPGGANAGKYYGDATIDGVVSIDGHDYHYGESGASDTQRDMNFQIKNDTKFYAVWVQKTYYTVDFFGNSTSNGGAANSVKVKSDTFTGPDNKTYAASKDEDGYKTDEAIYRTTSKYNFLDKPTNIKLPDGSLMFDNDDADAKFMGWSKDSDAKVADYKAGEVHEDMTMDENIVLSAVWAHPVKNVMLEDIEKPEYEGTPSEDIEATAASGVSVSKITWTPSADTFAAGTDYKLTVKMKANDGYYFKEGALPTVKMDVSRLGKVDAMTTELNPEGTVLTSTYTFTTTANVIVNSEQDENRAKAVAFTGVTAPEAGKKLVTVGNAGDSRVDQAHWFPAVTWTAKDSEGNPKESTATAEPDTTYTATLRVKPAKGYAFDENVTKVTFSGEEVPFSTSTSAKKKAQVDDETGELIVSYTFPATAPIDNAINLKLSGSIRNGQSLPDQTFTSADNVDKGSRMATIDWYKVEKNGDLTEVDSEKAKVSPSTTYVAQVVLEPAKGYSFSTETTVTFAGTDMQVLAKDAPKPTGDKANRWAQLQEDGSIRVSHDFTSSADVLQEIVAPGNVSTEYGTAVSAVEDLPREVQIITENGKANVDVYWIEENDKVVVVTEEGTEDSTNAAALNGQREAHNVKIQGTVAVPEGVTIPDGMEAKTTLTIKVAADPRLVPEANATALNAEAQDVIDRTPAEADEVTQELKTKLETALKDMNDYIATWNDENPSTVDGINDEMDKVRAAMYDLMNALEPIPVLPVKKLGEITIGEKLPTQALSTDIRVSDESKPADISWTNATKDTRVEEGKKYEAHIIFKPAYEGAFREGGLVVFDDSVQVEIHGSENTDGNRAWIDSEGNLHLIRTIEVGTINLVSIDECAALNADFGDPIDSVGLPKTVTASTDAGERKLAVNWNTEGIDLGDTNKREAHDVVVSGKAVKPDAIENPSGVSLDVEITIHVAADPRLVPEKKAADLKTEAAAVIADAEAAGIAKAEVAALQGAIGEMNDYITKYDDPEDPSTVDGINEKIKAAQDALDALRSFIEHNTVIEMTLFGTDESNDHMLDIGEKLKTTYNLVTATDKDNSVKTTAVKTKWIDPDVEDGSIKSATDYLVEVTLTASDKARFNVNRKINFDGVEILMSNGEPANDATSYAVLSEDGKSVKVARTYRSIDAEYEGVGDVPNVSVAYATEPGAVGMPEKVKVKTNDENKEYEAEIEWDLAPYEEDYANRANNKNAHEVEVTGTLKPVKGVEWPDEGVTVTTKIKVDADPDNVNESAGIQPGAHLAAVDKFILSRVGDGDPRGSKVSPLKLRSTKQTKKSIKVTWTKAKGASKYVLYGNLCGKKYKFKKITTTGGSTINVKKIAGKKLKKGKYYKFIVVAVDANSNVVSTSKIIHVATAKGKVGNHKKVTVKKAVLTKAAKLGKGKTLSLKAKAVAKSKKKKVRKHRAVIYESTNPAVATVSAKGVVKGVGAGTCYVYAYAQNGVYKAIKVVVK